MPDIRDGGQIEWKPLEGRAVGTLPLRPAVQIQMRVTQMLILKELLVW